MQGYQSSQEHLFDQLRRLDLLLNLRIARQRRDPAYAGFNEFRGLFISEDEIDRLVGRAPTVPNELPVGVDEAALLQAVGELEQQISLRVAAAVQQDVPMRLLRLARLFHLAPFDVDVLLICVAPELDLKYEKLYAYLQNDVTRKWPSIDLALNVLCQALGEKLQARVRLSSNAPLFKQQMVICADEGSHVASSWLSRPLRIDRRILDYLLGRDELDEELVTLARLVTPQADLTQTLLPSGARAELVRLCALPAGQNRLLLFEGPLGAGKKFTAEALCKAVGSRLLIADLPPLFGNGERGAAGSLLRLGREARLQTAALYLDHSENLGDGEPAAQARRVLFDIVAEFPGLVFIGSEQPWDGATNPAVTGLFKVVFTTPGFAHRLGLWQTFLAAAGHLAESLDLAGVADKFSFTPGKIYQAVHEAQHLALLRDGGVTAADLYAACRSLGSPRLALLARKITPLYCWEDIILPADSLRHLRELCNHARFRQQVFETWGFDRRIALGRGLSALFLGPSGTGKTMAAEIIARELNLDLYKIDLASMVSKYIGETEKNLSRIFDEAEQSNAILFFDEADALFGKRSEVRDSHDRYANIEVNYLLQRMEEYSGVVILASNFHRNIDEAFTRRLRFIVGFPFPEERDRERIWRSVYPDSTPLASDLDFGFLARKFKLPGGSIKNIALGSAFLAAENGQVVTMTHIVLAIRREFQKIGRACVKSDFEQYYDLVTGDEASP